MNTRDEVIEYLKSSLKDGDTIYTNVQHVSQSGMTRDIKIISIKENIPLNFNYYVSKALGYKIKNTPNSYDIYSREISLPIYPSLKEKEVLFYL